MKVLSNAKVVAIFFLFAGFFFPDVAKKASILLVPALVITMTLSLKDVHFGHFSQYDKKFILKLLFMNFFFMSAVMLLFTMLFVKDPNYRNGFILLAAMPPAMGIIPLAFILKADIKTSIVAELVSYCIAVVYSPLLIYLFFGTEISIFVFLKFFLGLLILPLLASRVLTLLKFDMHHHYTDRIVNVCYGFSIFIIVGVNISTFVNNFVSLIPVFLVLILTTFVTGSIVYSVVHSRKKSKYEILYVLFATFKNGSLMAALAVVLFNHETTVPVAVRCVLLPFYILFIEFLAGKFHTTHPHLFK